jgi:hypothetical protein
VPTDPVVDVPETRPTDTPITTILRPKKSGIKPSKGLATVMLSLMLGTGGIGWLTGKVLAPASGNCMYWHEDHYEPVSCNQKIPHARVIALDTVKLKNFRKITRPDTLTYEAMGKVWYCKINGKLEFYTSDGEHPVVFGRELKAITIYIIDKYILSGLITKQ